MESKQDEAEGAMAKVQDTPEGNKEGNKDLDMETVDLNSKVSNSKVSTAGFNHKGMFVRKKGISWQICGLFLLGDLAGGGIVSISKALNVTLIYPGLIACIFIGLIAMFTSVLLGRCWAMLQQRYPEYREHCRQVYAEIGNRSMGRWMKICVSITIDINQFGVCVVYLLLSAKSIDDTINAFTKNPLDYCLIVLILAAVILPVTFLKSPEDFWWAVLGGMVCSIGSVILIIVGSGLDYSDCSQSLELAKPDPISIFSALGTFVFAYGGHSSFPVIQHDMKRPFDFDKSSYMAFGMIMLLYLPMGIISNLTYGAAIKDSIINSVQYVYIQQSINLLIMLHCLMTLTLILNPFNQAAEDMFHAPHHFGWQRILIRTGSLSAITFVALTLPRFGPLLNLIGSSTTLLTVLVFPVLFYFYLEASGRVHDKKKELELSEKNKLSDKKLASDSEVPVAEYPRVGFMEMLRNNDKLMLFAGFATMAIGIVICVVASIAAVAQLAGAGNSTFVKPCYVQWFTGGVQKEPFSTYCCGIKGDLKDRYPLNGTMHCKDPFEKD